MEIKPYKNKNVRLVDVSQKYKEAYYQIKKITCEKYVNKYFGEWNQETQLEYNNKIFEQSLMQDCFKVIVKNNQTIGFFGYSVFENQIGCVTLQIVEDEERENIFLWLLSHLCDLSNKLNIPIYAKSFVDSKDIDMYIKAGFEIISKTNSHFLLRKKSKEENREKRTI